MQQLVYTMIALALATAMGLAGINYIAPAAFSRDGAAERIAADYRQMALAYDAHVLQVPGPPPTNNWQAQLQGYGLRPINNTDGFTWSYQRVPGARDWFCASRETVNDALLEASFRVADRIPDRNVVVSPSCGAVLQRPMTDSERTRLIEGPIAITIHMGEFSASTEGPAPPATEISDPDFDFTVAARSNVERSAVTVSDSVRMTGLPSGTYVSVSGEGAPQISVNGRAWSDRGTIGAGDTLRVRLTSAETFSTTARADVRVGSLTRPYTVRTRDPDLTPNSFVIADVIDVDPSQVVSSAGVVVSGLEPDYPIAASVAGGQEAAINVNGGAWATTLIMGNNDVLVARQTAAATFETTTQTMVTVGNGPAVRFRTTTRAADTMPDPIVLAERLNQDQAVAVQSDQVRVTGLEPNYPVPISISSPSGSNARFQIDGGPWITSGTILNDQSLRVRMTSGNFEQRRQANLQVGSGSAHFVVETRAMRLEPDAFVFAHIDTQLKSTLVSSQSVTIEGMDKAVPFQVSGEGNPQASVDGGAWSSTGSIAAGQSIAVRLTTSPDAETTFTAHVRIGTTSVPFRARTGNDRPQAYAYETVENAAPNAVVSSNVVTLRGMTIPAAVTVSGEGSPQFSIAGGPWVTMGKIEANQTLRLRLTSTSDEAGFSRVATVSVGGVTASWTVRTRDLTPDEFAFDPHRDVRLSTMTTSGWTPIRGMSARVPVTVKGEGSPQISVNGGAWTTSDTLESGASLRVRLESSPNVRTKRMAQVTVGTVTVPFEVTTGTNIPEAFAFNEVDYAGAGQLFPSESIRIHGMTIPGRATVSGEGNPQISVNGAAWTTSTTIDPGSSMQVRLTAANDQHGTLRTATVDIEGVRAPFKVSTMDKLPDPFSFAQQNNVPLNNDRFSETVVIQGLSAPADLQITGAGDPRLSVNGGAWSYGGTIVNGQTLAVRVFSPDQVNTTRTVNVRVGQRTVQFVVRTGTNVPAPFNFQPERNVDRNILVTSSPITLRNMTIPGMARVSGEGSPQMRVDGGSWVTSARVANGQSIELRLRSANDRQGTARRASLDVEGQSGDFVVTTIDTLPDAFSLTALTHEPTALYYGNNPSTSNEVTLSGLSTPVKVTAVDSEGLELEMRVNNWGWRPASEWESVSAGHTLTFRMQQSHEINTTKTATVNVGDFRTSWSVRTGNASWDPVDFQAQTNAAPGSTVISNSIKLSGMTTSSYLFTQGMDGLHQGEISVNGGPWTGRAWAFNGDTVRIRTTLPQDRQHYEGMSLRGSGSNTFSEFPISIRWP